MNSVRVLSVYEKDIRPTLKVDDFANPTVESTCTIESPIATGLVT